MKRMRILLMVATISSSLGDADPQYPGQGSPMMNTMMGPWSAGQQPVTRPDSGSGQCGITVDECCGMAQEGCCQAGQQCYTYYETVCENVTKKRCNPKFKQICVEETLPDCSIQKERRTANIFEQTCQLGPKRECFEWNRQVCDMRPVPVTAQINWTNEKLVANQTTTKQKCETVSKCKFRDVEEIKTEQVPVKNCTDIEDSRENCQPVAVPTTRVIEKIEYQTKWVEDCSVVTQPRCETSPCQTNGCTNGGNVCSTRDYQPQTVCPEGPVSGDGAMCQQVDMPVCYGNLPTCQYDQQCCYNEARRVCRQVPQRIPVKRNVTIQDVTWENKCETIKITRPECVTNWETKERTVTRQECDQYFDEVCSNYTVPQYDVKNEVKQENVTFLTRGCQFRNVTERYCHTFPNSAYMCQKKPATRDYILNKVVCRDQKPVKFCMNIPEGECENIPDQECRVVPRQVCQDGCSTSNMCNKCDSFRNQGGFSNCNTGTCNNIFMEDPVISGNWGTGGGFNPGNSGNSGFNPGNTGNSGFNPGNVGDSGFNPGTGGYNPGYDSGYNPGYNPGYGGGYNPGNQGDIVTVGDENAGQGGQWQPGGDWYSPDDRAQPLYPDFYRDGYTPLNQYGDSGFNPGVNTPLNPWGNGGNDWNTGGGYNPGYPGALAESQPNSNDAFEEDEVIEDESIVL